MPMPQWFFTFALPRKFGTANGGGCGEVFLKPIPMAAADSQEHKNQKMFANEREPHY
jgi:hypothetical protein